MRTRSLVPLALAAGLVLAACGGSGPEETADAPSAPPTGAPAPSTAPPADLEEGVAATIDGEVIAATLIDDRVERLVDQPGFSEGPEGQELDEEQVRGTLRAQVLTQAIFSHVILDGARELDAEPGPEEVAATRKDLVEQIGGEEQFQQQVEAAGFTEEELNEELRVLAAVDLIGERLIEQGEVDPSEQQQPPGPQQMSPATLAAQQWLSTRIQEADIQVDQDYGIWDASGQVIPHTG